MTSVFTNWDSNYANPVNKGKLGTSVIQHAKVQAASFLLSLNFMSLSELLRSPLSFYQSFALDLLGKGVSLQHP